MPLSHHRVFARIPLFLYISALESQKILSDFHKCLKLLWCHFDLFWLFCHFLILLHKKLLRSTLDPYQNLSGYPAFLWLQSVQVSWEQACLTDVVLSDHLHGQALKADSETTVGRHSVFETVKIIFHPLDVHAFLRDLL